MEAPHRGTNDNELDETNMSLQAEVQNGAAPEPVSATPAHAKTDAAENLDTSRQLVAVLRQHGDLDDEKLAYALRVHKKLGYEHSLTQVLQELGYISKEQLRNALKLHSDAVPLGNLLVELGHLRRSELQVALKAQKDPTNRGKRLGEFLIENRMIQEQDLIHVLADQLGFELLSLNFSDVQATLLNDIQPPWCKQHLAIPVRRERDAVVVAFADPLNRDAIAAARSVFGEIRPAIASRHAMVEAISQFQTSLKHAKTKTSAVDEAGATGRVEKMIAAAIACGTSDIHLEPLRNEVRIRFRRDGVLSPHEVMDHKLYTLVSNRIKILSKADISERRRHQDGAFRYQDPKTGQRCDVRVSWFATVHGEKIVMRILSRKAAMLDIAETGMAPRMMKRFVEDALDVPSGVVLVTGPTGSGKTTTLYGCINYLNNIECSIATAEDPVEYVVDGIAQCNLNAKLDVTFQDTLKAMLRQDPDVIVLGEIRDQFSAEAAIQAALTGHKVLTTFHTEDSIGGLLRLMNMQIETFLISSTVVSILAQRLLRAVCRHCSESYTPTAQELQRLNCTQQDLAGAEFAIGRGCSQCHYSGYSGRVGVFELLVLNESVKEAILAKRTSSEIRRVSVETSGLVTLLEDGLAKAGAGLISIQEVIRHLPRLGKPRSYKEILRLSGHS